MTEGSLGGVWALIFAVFVFGAIIGSFLNVCIYRIPAGMSVVSPPSRCPSCESPIRWYQNIPVVSWLILGGRCASCRAHISIRYPLIELLNGVLYVLAVFYFGLSLETLVYALFLSLLLVITFIDIDHQIIPNVISLPGIPVGILASFLVPWLTIFDSLFGVVLGGGLLLAVAGGYALVTGKEGMGMGDVKLLAMIGAFMGWKAVLPVVFIASIIGCLVGIPLMLIKGGNSKMALPFGPFLSAGAVFCLFWWDAVFGWYQSFFY